MASVLERGFTVIELMLFLAVTGGLFAALMLGTGNTITQQRYRESVDKYVSLLQNQYSEVANTRNEQHDGLKCDYDAATHDWALNPAATGDPRGASACVLLGRAVSIQNNGQEVDVYNVLGYKSDSSTVTGGDIPTLQAYKPKTIDLDKETTAIDWGSSLADISNSPSVATFLILRSPSSGLIRIFISSAALPLATDLSSIIADPLASSKLTNCVHGDSGSLPKQSVTVDPRIAGQGGVTVLRDDSRCL